jgi:uncharacterized protein YdhG (YjbR/CyaY superfamily)
MAVRDPLPTLQGLVRNNRFWYDHTMNDEGKKQVDEYLATLGDEQRKTLEFVRETIRSIVPDAREGLSYGLPAFFIKRPIAGYGAGKKHCAYYPMSGTVIEALAQELSGYETSKGAVKFPNDRPLPKSLIKKLLKARIAEVQKAEYGSS